tara:strand:+ start:2988 stop:4700 length:1713 start_codon:yes stop_codon:yes gene_type:complete
MCGIIAIYSKSKLDKKKCLNTLKTLKKRGPDKTLYNFFDNGKIFIGNTILSITGKQKKNKLLYNSNKKFIAFNGEIYNYKEIIKKFFNNQKFYNDTDLLIKLISNKGLKNSVKYLDGMYAFLIYDKKEKKIQFVTDPQGEKRFFIYKKDGLFILSSTINAIKYYVKKLDINKTKEKEYFETRHMLFFKDTIYKNLFLSMPGIISNFKNNFLETKYHFNSLKFINKSKYLKFKKMRNDQIVNYFDSIFKKQIYEMIPERKFGTIVSGGVDSSLISFYLNSLSKPHCFAGIDHLGKDKVIKKLNYFENVLKKNISSVKLSDKKYYNSLKKVYLNLGFPFLTHDYVSRHIISKHFKNQKCKVFFSGDGADELFGGYNLYSKIKWKSFKNSSPYSKINGNKNSYSEIIWNKAYKKFLKFQSPNEASIQSSLFTDYFIQGVSVANIGTDILSGENSIETRNPFIQKRIIENVINLPIKYKLNLSSKKNIMKCKPLLKQIFLKIYGKKLLFKKQGFSGFPNETKRFWNKTLNHEFIKFKKDLNINSKINKAFEWKLLNMFYFKKFLLNQTFKDTSL